ncbi:MAG: hypothetical protein KGI29_03275 [Pseudomonadota bacterium]|nr:hypothetical protein [Pseudomonadota bacterium]MDE3038756.1 hypothetical protein [Pseudomonadota bacterium]
MTNKKAWISLLTGGATGGVGLFGLTICCLPVAAGFSGVFGVIGVFSYTYSKYLLAAGITLLLLSIFLFLRSRTCKPRN